MGLGEAIKRLVTIEFQFRIGQRSQILLDERDLLLKAMDHLQIELGFDCDEDGLPDNVEIFQKAAATSCCRLMPLSPAKKKDRGASSKSPLATPLVTPAVEPPAVEAPAKVTMTPAPKKEAPKKKGLFGLFTKEKN